MFRHFDISVVRDKIKHKYDVCDLRTNENIVINALFC